MSFAARISVTFLPNSTFYRWEVSIEYLRRMWHVDRGRLLFRIPGPVPFGTCICSIFFFWDQRHPISIRYTRLWHYYQTEYFYWIWYFFKYWFPYTICNGCCMPTGDAYSSGHLIPSHLGLAHVLLVETNSFPELVVICPDYAIRTSLDTFSSLLCMELVGTNTVAIFLNHQIQAITEEVLWSIQCSS